MKKNFSKHVQDDSNIVRFFMCKLILVCDCEHSKKLELYAFIKIIHFNTYIMVSKTYSRVNFHRSQSSIESYYEFNR